MHEQGTDVRPDATALARWDFWRANAPRWRPERTWSATDAALVQVARPGAAMLLGLGEPAPLAELLGQVTPPADVGHVMLTRGTWDRLADADRARLGLVPGGTWDWLSTTRAPQHQPGEERVVELVGPDRLERVQACLALGYPERGPRPTDGESSWWGYELPGAAGLAGVVGVYAPTAAELAAGAGVHLQALTVVPSRRRRGVAAAMTAALTRWGLARGPLVHLGIWSDNDAARRVYERLGYVTDHRVENLHPRRP